MATKPEKTENTAPATGTDPFADCYNSPEPTEGKAIGAPDIDGWFAPEPGLTVVGQILAAIQIRDGEGKTRDVVCVKLSKPAKAVRDKKPVKLDPGQVIGVGIGYKLQALLEYVENQGQVYLKAKEKIGLKGGRSMWNYDVRVKGTKSAPVSGARVSDAHTDDLPF